MKTIIIVNGKPRAGKDSAVEAMTNLLIAEGVPVMAFSSIAPVRDMLKNAGFAIDTKTEADRDLMAAIGDAVELHSNWRTDQCIWKALNFFEANGERAVMFLHVREKAIIERFALRISGHPAGPFQFIKIMVTSPRQLDVQSNAADRDVGLIDYDYTIANDSTLDDLARRCDKALFTMGLVDQLSLLR